MYYWAYPILKPGSHACLKPCDRRKDCTAVPEEFCLPIPPGTIEEITIDARDNGYGERSGLPSLGAQTVDGMDPETTGQRQTLFRHVATLCETTVGELPDLRQDMPLPFVNVREHVRAIFKQAPV